jgi:hypothetical protein
VDRLIIVYCIPNIIKMNVHSATCICSIELWKQWNTLSDFLPNWNFRGVFSKYHYFVVRISGLALQVQRSSDNGAE